MSKTAGMTGQQYGDWFEGECQKMLDQLIRDFTNSIADAEDATAATIGNLRLLEADKAADDKAVAE